MTKLSFRLIVLVLLGTCVVSVVGPGVELVVTLTVVESIGWLSFGSRG